MDETRLIGQLGFADQQDGGTVKGIPIYGFEPITMTREGKFDMESGSQAIMPITWQGTTVLEYQFKFELVAGLTVATREELFSHMRTMHALTSHTLPPGGGVAGHPAARLFLGKYIKTRGVVRSCSTEARGPYDRDLLPTSCVFSGVFVIAPGYNAALAQVTENTRSLSSKNVLERFYSLG